jgi:hypothetical protein
MDLESLPLLDLWSLFDLLRNCLRGKEEQQHCSHAAGDGARLDARHRACDSRRCSPHSPRAMASQAAASEYDFDDEVEDRGPGLSPAHSSSASSDDASFATASLAVNNRDVFGKVYSRRNSGGSASGRRKISSNSNLTHNSQMKWTPFVRLGAQCKDCLHLTFRNMHCQPRS